MSAEWKWPGSRWWRVDLHTHSAASHDFRPPSDRTATDWGAWVSAATAAGLHAVALTDHNTPDGIQGIQNAAKGGGLTIFPGVEVTVNGVHVLCIFDPTQTRDGVFSFLSRLHIEHESMGRSDACSGKSIAEVIELATAAGALVVGAHVNGPNGLFVDVEGQERLKALRAPGLLAVELGVGPLGSAKWWPQDSADCQSWLDGTKTEGRALTYVWSSDSHALSEAGRRFTWVKMTTPNAEGLRLALLDGAGSLRPAKKETPGDPNRHADNVIESITVRDATYMGRPKPLTVDLNPWFNAIIGGRGTGKSTVVDLCRAVLRRRAELGGADAALSTAFDNRMRVRPRREAEGLLEPGTVVELTYRKNGERFVLSWAAEGGATAITRVSGDERVTEGGDIRERFPVRIYSQKQLFDLARDPNALLGVIDDSAQVRGAESGRLRQEAESKYLALCAEARSLRARVGTLPARAATLADLRRKLDLLQRGGHAAALSAYRERRKQDGTWRSIAEAARGAVRALGRSADESLVVPDLDLGVDAEEDEAIRALRAAHEELRVAMGDLRQRVLDAVAQANADIEQLRTGTRLADWRAAVTATEHQYQAVTGQLAAAGIGNPEEYRDLLQRATALEQEILGLERQRSTADEREREAQEALAVYRQGRAELTQRRAAFAAQTSGAHIKVEIEERAERGGLEDFVRNALGIAHYDADHAAIVHAIQPAVEGAPWSFSRVDDCVATLRGVLADPQKQWPCKDRRFEAALRKVQPERLDRLALYLPDDAVKVSFHDSRNGRPAWRPLAQGSPGQQTSALLAFVLGYGDEPIVLDQPEDDLDNTLIYDLVVPQLRARKPNRQVIVVTHNPNIVVHGDAELVVSLEALNGQTRIVVAGGLQEQKVRDEICRVMEGGRDAFETRYRRIMLSGGKRDGRP